MEKLLPEDKLHFIGVLANVNSTILKLQLDNEFKVESLSENEAIPLFSTLDNLPTRETLIRLFMDYSCLHHSEKRLYLITNSFDVAARPSNVFPPEFSNFQNNKIEKYLVPLIKLLRLFKEGGISMPLQYIYSVKDGVPQSNSRLMQGIKIISHSDYSIEDNESSELSKFLQETKFPFQDPFLQLALENYELSYCIHNQGLSFLSLMMGLESIVNDSSNEIQYRTSRNTAVLLGEDKEKADLIFKEIKEIYKKRSKIIHTGVANAINKNDLLNLRAYLRRCIKSISKLKKSKEELMDLLNVSGFGVRPT